MKNMNDLARKLVEYGTKKGADEIQVSIGQSSQFSVDIREGNIEKLLEAGSRSLSLKVILDKKVANASSSDFSEETLHKLVENAIARAKYTSSDEFAGLPEKSEIEADIKSLNLFDQAVVDLSPEAKIAAVKEIEKIALGNEKVNKSSGASYGTSINETFLANSNGFSGSYKSTSCSAGVYLQAGEEPNVIEDGWYSSARNLNALKSNEEIALKAVHNVTRLIGAEKIATQNVPVILEPNMTSRILGFLSQCLSGHAIYMGQSFLAGKINEIIAVDNLKIWDDGLLPNGLNSKPFDREGVPTSKKAIIENGMLKNYLLDTYSAKKLEMNSTGNAGGATNLYLEAGEYTPDEIIKSVKKGLLLVKTMGQGTVPTTGDISTGAFGIWIENGELTYPVAEITINGNLGDMLKDIQMVGNDLVFDRSVTGPTIKIGSMSLAGK